MPTNQEAEGDAPGCLGAEGGTEVGMNDAEGTLRIWRAREAIRQGEAILGDLSSSMDQMRGRASSILTWNVGAITALVAASLTHPGRQFLPAGTFFTLSALACLTALWPAKWRHGFYKFSEIKDALTYPTELENLEAAAQQLELCIDQNEQFTSQFTRHIRIAWVAFALAPFTSLAVVL